jgi:hypothetical protein
MVEVAALAEGTESFPLAAASTTMRSRAAWPVVYVVCEGVLATHMHCTQPLSSVCKPLTQATTTPTLFSC